MASQSSRNITSEPDRETIDQYDNAMRPFWHPVLPSADLADGKPRGVELLAEPIVLARLRRYNQTDTYWGSARNFNLSAPAYDEEFEKMQDLVREQDRRVVESQRPWLLPPFWTKLELPVRPADLPLIEYHRWVEELGISLTL